MTFFGTQPTLTHVPPRRAGSNNAARAPCSAARCAVASPPLPPPKTNKSNCRTCVSFRRPLSAQRVQELHGRLDFAGALTLELVHERNVRVVFESAAGIARVAGLFGGQAGARRARRARGARRATTRTRR